MPRAESPVVSVLLPVFNRADLTLRCLRSLAAIQLPMEIVVIDNASTDLTAALLGRTEGAIVVRNTQNVGFLAAINQAADLARGETLLLLNSDTEVLPGSLEAALETLSASTSNGAVVGRLVHPDGKLQEAGAIVWRDASCQSYGRGDDPNGPAYMFRRAVDYGSAAFLLTRRATFLELGGFDSRFSPAYYEDVDYCVRLWERGQQVIYEPKAVVLHHEFGSAPPADAIAMQLRQRPVFAERHRQWLAAHALSPEAGSLNAHRAAGSRLLLIEDRVPHERFGSGYPRSLEITRAAVALGHHVTIYPLQMPDESWDEAYSDVPREAELMLNLGTQGLGQFLRDRVDYFDTIIVSRPHNMAFVRAVLPPYTVERRPRLVYDAEAVFAVRDIDRRRHNGHPMTAAAAEQLVDAELSLASGCDLVLTVSRAEQQRFLERGFPNVTVLGNAIALEPTSQPFSTRADFLFVGAVSDDNAPNADSIRWMVRELLPRLQARLGDVVRLVIAGRHDGFTCPGLNHSSVELKGMVNDLRPLFERARVFLAPTWFGAGIPIKVQWAAALGVPVVASPLIASQLGWQAGVELSVADSAEAFADSCSLLYRDEDLWQRQREAALARVGNECSRDVFRETLQHCLGHPQMSFDDDRTSGVGPASVRGSKYLTDEGIPVVFILLTKKSVLPIIVQPPSRSTNIVIEHRCRLIDNPAPRRDNPETEIDVVELNAKAIVVEPSEPEEISGSRQQTGTRHRRDVPQPMRQPLVAWVISRQSREHVLRCSLPRRHHHTRMVDCTSPIEQLGANTAYVVDREPSRHLLQPSGLDGLDVVVEMQHQRRADLARRGVDQPRIVEALVNTCHAYDPIRS